MTDAVRAYAVYAFDELGLLRLTAHTFEFNVGSSRVLEKNGFKLEGRLRQHFRKGDKLLDARIYGLLRDDVSLMWFSFTRCMTHNSKLPNKQFKSHSLKGQEGDQRSETKWSGASPRSGLTTPISKTTIQET